MVGVDLSDGMLTRAGQAVAAAGLTNVDLVRADAGMLDRFPAGSFDLVLCSAGLLYLLKARAPARGAVNTSFVALVALNEAFSAARPSPARVDLCMIAENGTSTALSAVGVP